MHAAHRDGHEGLGHGSVSQDTNGSKRRARLRPPFAFINSVATLTAATPAIPASDLRRAISRQTWLANRARNALQRPAFIGATSVATFVTALVSLIVVPRTKPPARIPVVARP